MIAGFSLRPAACFQQDSFIGPWPCLFICMLSRHTATPDNGAGWAPGAPMFTIWTFTETLVDDSFGMGVANHQAHPEHLQCTRFRLQCLCVTGQRDRT